MLRQAEALRQAIANNDEAPFNELVAGGAADVLIWAAGENQLDILQALLRAGADANAKGPAKMTPLYMAADEGHVEAARALLDAGADPNAKSSIGVPLVGAVRKGRADVVRLLVERGAKVGEARWSWNAPMLSVAADKGDAEVVRALLDGGADPNEADKRKRSPLMEAAAKGHVEMVRLLVAAGARVNPPPREPAKQTFEDMMSEKGTPLILAAKGGQTDAVAELIGAGADVVATDDKNQTAYDWARKNKHDRCAALLKEAGGAPAGGASLADLLAAADVGDVAGVRAALAAGVDVDGKDPAEFTLGGESRGGMTALQLAARAGHADVVRALLDAGADVEQWSDDMMGGRRPALLYAAAAGREAVVRMLLDAGANVAATGSGMSGSTGTALHAAAEAGHAGVVRVLLDAGAKVNDKSGGNTPLSVAAREGRLDVLRMLLDAGAKVDQKDRAGTTALHDAAAAGKLEAVRLLIERGAAVNVAAKDTGTALHAAAGALHSRTIRYDADGNATEEDRGDPLGVLRTLLAAGADPNLARGDGETVLTSAAGQPAVVRLLLEHKADPSPRKRDGTSALWWATIVGAAESVKLLLAAGADPNVVDREGRSCLDIALDRDMAECASLLEAAGAKRGKDLDAGREVAEAKKAKERKEEQEAEASQRKYEAMRPDFTKAAESQAFKDAVKKAGELIGAAPETKEQAAGIVFFKTTRRQGRELLAKHHAALLERGAYLYSCGRATMDDEADWLALAPTTDKYAVMLAMGTNACNYGRGPVEVVAGLKELEKDVPCVLTHISFDTLEGEWTGPIQNPAKFAKKLYEFCPDIVDQGVETVAALSKQLKKSNKLFFWWD
jgi:ankyrin repeat protein